MDVKAFEWAIAAILRDEDGKEAETDPSKMGSKFGLRAHHLEGTELKVDELTVEDAKSIYAKLFREAGCKDFSPGLAYFLLDCSVRYNPALARRWLRFALKLDQLSSDEMVQNALENITTRDTIVLMDVFIRRRMKSDPMWPTYRHWWTNRANRARDRAVKLSKGEL